MSPDLVLPLLEGLVAGLVVATVAFLFISRTQRSSARQTLAAAREQAQSLVADRCRSGGFNSTVTPVVTRVSVDWSS